MTAAGRAPRGACLGKETGRLPLEPSNPRRPVPVHPECAAGRRGPPPAVHSGVRVKVWEKPGGDEGSGFQGTRWQNRVHVPVQADAWGDKLGGAPPPAHTATGEPRPRVLTAACDWHWAATLPGAARGPAAEAETPGPRAPLPRGPQEGAHFLRAWARRRSPAVRQAWGWAAAEAVGGGWDLPHPNPPSKPRQVPTRLPARRAQRAAALQPETHRC